ncbi:MAG TPA: hypothetical protein VGR26_07500 [Acidimicrobiales bacterium]|nr:hypothetical protein [Acidimicrobiales bacterium]
MSDESMGKDDRFKGFLSTTALYEVEHDPERGARLRAELGLP